MSTCFISPERYKISTALPGLLCVMTYSHEFLVLARLKPPTTGHCAAGDQSKLLSCSWIPKTPITKDVAWNTQLLIRAMTDNDRHTRYLSHDYQLASSPSISGPNRVLTTETRLRVPRRIWKAGFQGERKASVWFGLLLLLESLHGFVLSGKLYTIFEWKISRSPRQSFGATSVGPSTIFRGELRHAQVLMNQKCQYCR